MRQGATYRTANATQQMAKFQQETGAKAEVFIGSGDVPKVLSLAAKQTEADLLVTGCYPYRPPAHARLWNHLRSPDSGSERLRKNASWVPASQESWGG